MTLVDQSQPGTITHHRLLPAGRTGSRLRLPQLKERLKSAG